MSPVEKPNRVAAGRGIRSKAATRWSAAWLRWCAAMLAAGALAIAARGSGSNPAPTVLAVAPASVAAGATNVTLSAQGGGFVSGSVVQWNGTALATTYVSAEKLSASLPDALVASPGGAAVTVVNPAPGGGISTPAYLTVGQQNSPVTFAGALTATVGSFPIGITTADFNGDGIPDVATADDSDNTVAVLLGNGDGTFTPQATLTTGNIPVFIVAGDFNHDGKTDLAVSNVADGTISVFLGDGTGNFTLASSPAGGAGTYQIATGDFNGDGNLDLLAADSGATASTVLLGNGDGTFTPAASSLSVPYASFLTVGDFNEDGKLDVAVEDDNGIDVSFGNGDGTFQTPVTVLASGSTLYPQFLTVADFNNDGHLDLAVNGSAVSGPYTAVQILTGDGTGAFAAGTPLVLNAQYSSPLGLTAGDFNGDGLPDIVVAVSDFSGPANTTLYFIPVGADGALGTPQDFGGIDMPPYQLAAADFNNDGALDLATPDSFSSVGDFLQIVPAVVSPANITFPDQATGSQGYAVTVTLTNQTGGTLNIFSVAINGADASEFVVTDDQCLTSPSVTTSCTVSIAFSPTALGLRTASLTISDGDCSPISQTIALSGTGVLPVPTVSLTPSGLTFASQAVGTQSAARSATLAVTNSIGLAISGISITGADPGDFSESDDCGSSVAGLADCTIGVKFLPTAAGARAATLTVTDNAGDSPESVTLSGTGSQATPSLTWVNPADIEYGVALSSAQLDASSGGIAGSFVYAPPAGTMLPVGSHTLSVTFTPTDTADYSSNTATATINVNRADTTASLAPPAASYFGDSVTLTATVVSTTSGTPTGTVTFLDGATTLGTATLSGGTASYTTSLLTVGSHMLSASYGGDSNDNASVSPGATGVVNATYSITLPTGVVTGRRGSSIQIPIEVPPSGGAFSGAVALAVSGLPAGVTAVFNPANVTPGANGASATLTLTFPVSLSSSSFLPSGGGPGQPFSLPATASLAAGLGLIFAWASRARKLRRALAAAGFLAVIAVPGLFVAGCGSAGVTPIGFTATVTGTSGSISHSASVAVTVD